MTRLLLLLLLLACSLLYVAGQTNPNTVAIDLDTGNPDNPDIPNPDPPLSPIDSSTQKYNWTTSCGPSSNNGYDCSLYTEELGRKCWATTDGSPAICACSRDNGNLISGCNNRGICTYATKGVPLIGAPLLGSPLNKSLTNGYIPFCACSQSYTGAFCEQQPALSDRTYTTWKWALPALPESQDGVTITQRNATASIEYGFHALGRTQSYSDYTANDGPSQPPLTSDQYLATFMQRPSFGTNFLPAPVDRFHEINIVQSNAGHPSSNCPAGMQKYNMQGPFSLFQSSAEYYCGCIPGGYLGTQYGCNSHGTCISTSVPIQGGLEPTMQRSLQQALVNWCGTSPLQCNAINSDSQIGLSYTFVLPFLASPANWYNFGPTPVCLCESDEWTGYYCELYIGDQLHCNGHGTWDPTNTNQPCTCDTDKGWEYNVVTKDCSTPNYDYFYCGNNGYWDPILSACHCYDTSKWGLKCDQDCSQTHCNGRGVCVLNSTPGFNDGLTYPGISTPEGTQPDRVSNICQCNEYDDLVVSGPHCTIVSAKNVICDDHGTETNAGLLTDGVFHHVGVDFLDDKVCTPNSENVTNGVVYAFVPSTGRTVAYCPVWIYLDTLDASLSSNTVEVYIKSISGFVTLPSVSPSLDQCGGADSRGYCTLPGPLDVSSTGTCTCYPGFAGPVCEHQRCVSVNGGVCSGNGICQTDINRCACFNGFVGDACEEYDEDSCNNDSQYIGSA